MFLLENAIQIQTRTISNTYIFLILISLAMEFLLHISFYPSQLQSNIPVPEQRVTSEGLTEKVGGKEERSWDMEKRQTKCF